MGFKYFSASRWVRPSVLLLLGTLSILALSGARTPAGRVSSSLSCESARRLGDWAKSKTPSHAPESLSQPEFSRKVLSRLLELADPNKVVFLQSEADAFLNESAKDWAAFVGERRCDGFEAWFQLAYARGMDRVHRLIRQAPLQESVPAKLAKLGTDEKGFPWFVRFAKDEGDLAKRLRKYADAVGESVSAEQLAAFKGDKRALIEFGLLRVLFSDGTPAPVHVLARALVNTMDPFSDYFSDSEYADFYRELTGGTSGVGVRVRDVPAGLLVQKVIKDSPAGESKAIHAGDVITAVDGKDLLGMSAQKTRHVLEGAEFSAVVLKILDKSGATRTVRLVRRSFAFEDERVELRMLPMPKRPGSQVAVISIPSFYGRGGSGLVGERSSAEDVEAALLKAMASRPAAVVLDMRGNPGGYLEEAVAMAGLFIGNRPVVAVVESQSSCVMRDHHAQALYNGPLLALVDDQSASAAEILAGALKDYNRAVVLGSPRTYGKGSVQRLFHLESGLVDLPEKDRRGVLKLTTSFFYSPLGHSPASGGIEPHLRLADAKKRAPEDRPKRLQSAPEQKPFVDEALLGGMRLEERVMQSRIEALKQNSEVREDHVREIFENVVRQAFGPTKTDESARSELAETLAVAEDLVAMESQRTARSSRSSGDKKDGARAVGYGNL